MQIPYDLMLFVINCMDLMLFFLDYKIGIIQRRMKNRSDKEHTSRYEINEILLKKKKTGLLLQEIHKG